MSARWYKRCGADFIHGTMMLTLEEKGAYSLCLDLIYDRGGPIADDARWLSGVCGVSIRKWNAIRQRLLDLGKLVAEDGHLSNARAHLELVSAELSSRERSESGAKGGRKRAENHGPKAENNDLEQAELKRLEKIREDKIREEVVEASPQARAQPQPVAEAVDIWNEACALTGWKAVQRITPARRQSLSARLRTETLDGWQAAVNRARSSPYLGHDPPPAWFTFDWITKSANFIKLIEGNYDHRVNGHSDGSESVVEALARVKRERAAEEQEAGRDDPGAWTALPSYLQ